MPVQMLDPVMPGSPEQSTGTPEDKAQGSSCIYTQRGLSKIARGYIGLGVDLVQSLWSQIMQR